ncbi:hypothetical protein OHA77_16365 [Streptosporangium sp. NBC_01639]|uniref:hypothetical protein n=1 Tax=Streptosporangium sp. NBC_01639 TaxID=2975948 RepID=UPI0038675505|nr:hypothetical protein OHA77_16365 [Streptosporangium sp. NBC_01639]
MGQSTSGSDSARARHGSWLKWLYAALLAALLAATLLSMRQLVESVTLAFGQGATVSVAIPVDRIRIDPPLPPNVELAGDHLQAVVRSANGSLATGVYHLFTWLPPVAVNILSCWWMVRLLAAGRGSDRSLFSARTTRNLRLVGVLQLAGALVIPLAENMIQGTLSIHVISAGAYYDDLSPYGFSGGALIGLSALAVSEIIRKGRHMLEDLEGTI